MADSFTESPDKKVFNCLGIEALRAQLQGLDIFSEQFFCINACRTPAEWAITSNDQIEMVGTLGKARFHKLTQARFFAADELEAAPVEATSACGFSNGFAEAVAGCIEKLPWPPRAGDWQLQLHNQWPNTKSDGIAGLDRFAFKQLYDDRHSIDRTRQHKLVKRIVDDARTWNSHRTAEPGDLWRSTIIDLHARTADCLDMLMHSLENSIFTEQIVAGGIQRADRWPARDQDIRDRERALTEELTYCLVEDSSLVGSKMIDALVDLTTTTRVVYIEIDGPCEPIDEQLIASMLGFWRNVVNELHILGTRVPHLPLLLIGHIEPDSAGPQSIDTTRYYHSALLRSSDERRLNLIEGDHLFKWVRRVFPDGDLRRPGVERELALALGSNRIERVSDVSLLTVVDAVEKRAI
jgi:hypothetical protein